MNIIIAVMMLTYSSLKFADKPLLTTCVFIQTCNIALLHPECSTACKCGWNLILWRQQQQQQQQQQQHHCQKWRTHPVPSIDVSCVGSVADWTSVVQRIMMKSCICYAHACRRMSYGRVEGGLTVRALCSFRDTAGWWQNWIQKLSSQLMRQPW